MQDKASLRQAMLLRRAGVDAQQAVIASLQARDRLLPLLQHRRVVMLYSPFRGELSTWPVAHSLQSAGLKIALPLTDRRQRLITPAQVANLESLVAGTYGILEPAEGSYTTLLPGQLDAVVVPGACFDLAGYRIGYGGGYYDRFLPRLRDDCLTVGFGYDWQLVPQLASDPWDQPLHCLVTDQRVVDVKIARVTAPENE